VGDAFDVFSRNKWYVSRLVYNKCFDVFDIYNLINTLDIPTHDTHQWLLLQFLVLLLMIAESVRKIYSVNSFVSKKQYCPKMHLVVSLYIIDLNRIYIRHKEYFLQEGKQSVICF